MSKNVSIDKMSDAIGEILQTYGDDIALDLKEEVKKAGKSAVKELKADSPKKTGDYRKGWTSKTTEEKAHKITVVVHNKTEYQLAHLLENGHALVSKGGRTLGWVEGIPHIAKVEEKTAEELGKKIEIIIKKG